MKNSESQAPAINEQVTQNPDAPRIPETDRIARLLACATPLTGEAKYAVVYYNGSDVLYSYTKPVQLIEEIHRQMETYADSEESDKFVEREDNTWIITSEGTYRWRWSLEHYCYDKSRITEEHLAEMLFSDTNRDSKVDMTCFQDEFHPLINIAERRLAV